MPTARFRIDADGGVLIANSPAQAWHLAGDLGGLIDEMIIEGLDWRAFTDLVPESLDTYWSITLRFLQIAIDAMAAPISPKAAAWTGASVRRSSSAAK